MQVKIGRVLACIEARWLEVNGLSGDLSKYPLTKEDHLQVLTNKDKSDKHGEVFTPLWLVDDMIKGSHRLFKDQDKTTEDLCAGYGQFTIRIMRAKYKLLGEDFDIAKFLTRTHLMVELQPYSCFRLLKVFGFKSRILMGDASKKGLLPDEAVKGIWVWSEECGKWFDRTTQVSRIFKLCNDKKTFTWDEKAQRFEDEVEKIRDRAVRKTKKGSKDAKRKSSYKKRRN